MPRALGQVIYPNGTKHPILFFGFITSLDSPAWLELIEALQTSTHPQLLLQSKGRDYILAYCDSIEQHTETIIRSSKYKINASDVEAAYKVRLILQEDFEQSHSTIQTCNQSKY
jgi:hypothetical protein